MQLRIIEAVLPAGSTHTLRVTYALGAPQASTAGTYQPSMSWSNGPRLAFNFGFTDLGAGRYLEAWIPANLIFDQFELMLTLRILNTMIAHTVITNGEVISVGTNHWQVKFPSRFTAHSPLLELRASDTLVKATDAVTPDFFRIAAIGGIQQGLRDRAFFDFIFMFVGDHEAGVLQHSGHNDGQAMRAPFRNQTVHMSTQRA